MARCTHCEFRFAVPRATFAQLREPATSDLRDMTWTERLGFTFSASMNAGQMVLVIAGVVFGMWITFRADSAAWLLPILLASWWVGRLCFPESRREALLRLLSQYDCRVCIRCRYPLIGLGSDGTCPECGMTFDLVNVQAHWKRAMGKAREE